MKDKMKAQTKTLADKVFNNWYENRVVYPIVMPEQLESIGKRAYCIVVCLKAPIKMRFANFSKKYKTMLGETLTLEKFIDYDDKLNFNLGIEKCEPKAKIVLYNNTTLDDLFKKVKDLDFIAYNVFRPDWDTYFLKVATIVKQRTNCMKRAVGAVIAVNNRIVSTGYNGTPTGIINCYEGGCPRCNSNAKQGVALDQCNCIHAEENCVLEAGVHRTKGGTIYTTLFPCLWCSKIILQAGLKKVVYEEEYVMENSVELLQAAGVELKKIKLP